MGWLYIVIALIVNAHLLVSACTTNISFNLFNDSRITSPPFESDITKSVLLCAYLCIRKKCVAFSFVSDSDRCDLHNDTISETEELVFQANSTIYIIDCGVFESDGLVVTGHRQLGLQASFSCEPGYYSIGANYSQCNFSAQWSPRNPCVLVRTCYEAYELGILIPNELTVKPNSTMDAVDVNCVNDGPDVLTVVGHDQGNEVIITTDANNRFHHIPVTYNISILSLTKIIDVSDHCRQYMKLKCRHTNVNDNGHYLLNRLGEPVDYFIGGAKNIGMVNGLRTCGCYTNKSCYVVEKVCNCDANDFTWREDVGYLTDKEDLPMTEFVGADTESSYEQAIILIGNVECSGKA